MMIATHARWTLIALAGTSLTAALSMTGCAHTATDHARGDHWNTNDPAYLSPNQGESFAEVTPRASFANNQRNRAGHPYTTGPVGAGSLNVPANTEPSRHGFTYSSNLNLFGDILAPSLPTEIDHHGNSPDVGNISQVTFTHEGSDFDPSISPCGKFLVFSSTQHRPTADIYVRPINSHVVTQLTNSPFNDVMPSVSPCGERIAFASDRNGNWDIFVMPAAGGKAVQITTEGAHELHPSWSPDGNSLVFCRLGEVSGRWELWVVDLSNTGLAHHIGFGLFPQWCPVSGTGVNGSDKIVFQRSRERGERAFSVWTLDYKQGVARNQTQVAFSNYSALINPTWSPDGRFIVYASVPNPSQWPTFADAEPEEAAIHMIDAFGMNHIRLTNGGAVDLMPTFGRNGDLYFVSNRNGAENIWSMNTADAIFAATGRYPTNNYANTGRPNNGERNFVEVPVPEGDR